MKTARLTAASVHRCRDCADPLAPGLAGPVDTVLTDTMIVLS